MLVAVLAIVLVVTGGVALVTEGAPTPQPSGPTAPPTQPGPDGPAGFPPTAFGTRVISVGEALALTGSGVVDGRAMAVGGWWIADLPMSCPYPGRSTLPIEGYCTTDHLSSAPYESYTCQTNPDGSGGCHSNPVPPGVQVMPALMLQETAGADGLSRVPDAHFKNGTPVVLIVHVGDLRSRQCPAGSQDACSAKAIVDRIAWVAGEDVESGARIDILTALTPDEAVFASRFEGTLFTAFPVRLGEAWTIDPRFHGIGDDPVWVIRGSPNEPPRAPEDPSRAIEVRLVDDGTSTVVFTGRMAPGADYVPARLLVQATEPEGVAGNGTGVYYRVESSDALPVGLIEARMGPTMQSADDPRNRSIGAPVLLDPGNYLVRVWRALVPGDGHAHFNECTQQVSLAALGEVAIEAAFADEGDCSFVTPTFENDFAR